MRTVAVIPARSGSKRLPRKNILTFAGMPLLRWTIRAAQQAGLKRIIVTTDGDDIAEIAENAGASIILRPSNLASDAASTLDTVRHAVSETDAEIIVLLQPTSPLRTAADITACLELHAASGRSVVSVTETTPWPFWRGTDGSLVKADVPTDARAVAPNGAIYVCSRDALATELAWYASPMAYVMPKERSIDIDTAEDFALAEWYAAKNVQALPFEQASGRLGPIPGEIDNR